jgi:hypothetical protein
MFRSWWQKIKKPQLAVGIIVASVLVITLIVGIIGGYIFNWAGNQPEKRTAAKS